MLDALFALINAKAGIGHLADILKSVEELLSYFSSEYMVDGNAKDAAIDSVIAILQSHKSNSSKK